MFPDHEIDFTTFVLSYIGMFKLNPNTPNAHYAELPLNLFKHFSFYYISDFQHYAELPYEPIFTVIFPITVPFYILFELFL